MHGRAMRSLALAMLVVAGCGPAADGDAPAAEGEAGVTAEKAAQPVALPPGAEGAVARLRQSPRHGEWAMIPAGAGDSVRAWVVYPERSDPAPVVVVVHEIFGLTNWVRAVADQLAADGFIAIAPDLLTGQDIPTDSAGDPQRDVVRRAIRSLQPDDVHRRLSAAATWGMALPAATDRYGIVGFCWGGSTSFAHATRAPDLDAAVVYYGSSPDREALANVQAPVLGLYGGDDARVGATVPPAQAAMQELGKTYEVHSYEGAGHGFLRQQNGRDGANMRASEQAWPETIRWFRTYLEAAS
ncbi:MAG TPA: dienelactone hydrolase family protein [Longimicrobiales bacterium]